MSENNLDWGAIIEKSGAKNTSELAKLAGISDDLLYLAQSGKRPLSSTTRQALLKILAQKFKTLSEMELWLKTIGWDKEIIPYLYKEEISFLSQRFTSLVKFPQTLNFPGYYVSRPELEKQVIDALLNRKSTQALLAKRGLIISGMGGTGKSTLVSASLHHAVTDFHLWDTFPAGIHFIDFEKADLDQANDNLALDLGIAIQSLDRNVSLRPLIKKELKDKNLVFVLDGIKSIYDIEGFLDIINPKTSFLIASTRHKINLADQSRLYLDQLEIPEQFSLDEAQSAIFNITGKSFTNSDEKVFKNIYELVAGLPLAIIILAGLSSATQLSWKTISKSLTESSMRSLEFGEKSSKHDSVRIAFDLSYRYLKRKSPIAAGLFMKTGLFPRPKGKLSALEHVANLDDPGFQSALDTLVHANLIRVRSESSDVYYWSTHILLRDYAEEIRLNKDPRRSAIEKRYVDYISKIVLDFDNIFNHGQIQAAEYADAVPEICHAIGIAVNHNWGLEVAQLVRLSVSPMIDKGQFHALEFIEQIEEKDIRFSAKEKAIVLNAMAKIKLWNNDRHGAIRLLESVISSEFPTESVNAARTLAQVYIDEGDMEAANKQLDLVHSILKELPADYPYSKEVL